MLQASDASATKHKRHPANLILFIDFKIANGREISTFLIFLERDAIVSRSPAAKVDQLASLGTEGPPGIIFPSRFATTKRASHHAPHPAKHERPIIPDLGTGL